MGGTTTAEMPGLEADGQLRMTEDGTILDPGAMTESLMDSLRFVGDYHDAARGGSFRLDIDVQAVQAKNQQASDTALDVLDVVGWPEAN